MKAVCQGSTHMKRDQEMIPETPTASWPLDQARLVNYADQLVKSVDSSIKSLLKA